MSSDDRLNQMIESFQKVTPDREQMLKWYAAVEKKRRQKSTFLQIAASLAAGIAIGILCAGLALKGFKDPNDQENFDATFALVSVKNLE